MPGGKRALDDVSFDVPRGQIFGLLGPNGAGKSTLINILAGLVVKTGGKVNIWGFDIDQHPRNAKRSIGVVPQEIIFDPFFTPRETLEIQAGLYGIPPAERQSDELLAAMHLTDKANAYSRTLSGGMKRRLLVAKAMVHSPPILVLDEPTAGVDVELRRQLWDYVRQLHAQGVTIVLTTHYLEEAEELCDRIAIIHHGQVIANEPTRELVSKAQEKAVVVTFDRDIAQVPTNACFENIALIDERTLEITYRKDKVNAGAGARARSTAEGLSIVDVSTRDPDLEDVFLSLASADAGGGVSNDCRRPHRRLRRGRADGRAQPRRDAQGRGDRQGRAGEGATRLGAGRDRRGARGRRQLRSACQRHDDRRRRASTIARSSSMSSSLRPRAIARLIELGVPFAQRGRCAPPDPRGRTQPSAHRPCRRRDRLRGPAGARNARRRSTPNITLVPGHGRDRPRHRPPRDALLDQRRGARALRLQPQEEAGRNADCAARPSSRPAAPAAPISIRPRRAERPATGSRWRGARAAGSPTWSSCSSTRPASTISRSRTS